MLGNLRFARDVEKDELQNTGEIPPDEFGTNRLYRPIAAGRTANWQAAVFFHQVAFTGQMAISILVRVGRFA